MAQPDGGHIVIETDDRLPFAKVPAPVLCDTELSAGARLLYGILVWLGWREAWQGEPGYAGQEALSEEFGIPSRTARRYVTELEEGGYIRQEVVGLGQPANIIILPLETAAYLSAEESGDELEPAQTQSSEA